MTDCVERKLWKASVDVVRTLFLIGSSSEIVDIRRDVIMATILVVNVIEGDNKVFSLPAFAAAHRGCAPPVRLDKRADRRPGKGLCFGSTGPVKARALAR